MTIRPGQRPIAALAAHSAVFWARRAADLREPLSHRPDLRVLRWLSLVAVDFLRLFCGLAADCEPSPVVPMA